MVPKITLVFFVLVILCVVQSYAGLFSFQNNSNSLNQSVRFGGHQECAHANTTYGRRLPGDWKAYSEVFNKSGSMFWKTTVDMKYPSNGSKSYCPISSINIENLYRKCKCYKEKVEITQGGLGYGYTTLKITSDYNCRNVHRVTIYTRC